MVFWKWFFLFFTFIPMMVAWFYTAVDIFGRYDIGGLAKFLRLLLILFVPIIGMLIYVHRCRGTLCDRAPSAIEQPLDRVAPT